MKKHKKIKLPKGNYSGRRVHLNQAENFVIQKNECILNLTDGVFKIHGKGNLDVMGTVYDYLVEIEPCEFYFLRMEKIGTLLTGLHTNETVFNL